MRIVSLCIAIFSIFLSLNAHSESFFRFRYSIEEKSTLGQVLNKFTNKNVNFKNESPSILKTKSQNPNVVNWNYLETGLGFDIYLEKKLASKKAIAEYIKRKDRTKVVVKRNRQYQLNVFYMASNGIFQQSNQSKSVKIEFKQYSPYTFGIGYNYLFKNKPYQWVSSLYLSHLETASTNFDQNVSLQPEIGFNLYFQYDEYKRKNSYYFGFDYERFNTFNLPTLESSSISVVDLNFVSYLTAGLASSFAIFKLPVYFKFSVSKSLTYERKFSSSEGISHLSGFKAIVFFSTPIGGKWTFNLMQKYHSFSGDEKLSTIRYGAGFGYVF